MVKSSSLYFHTSIVCLTFGEENVSRREELPLLAVLFVLYPASFSWFIESADMLFSSGMFAVKYWSTRGDPYMGQVHFWLHWYLPAA